MIFTREQAIEEGRTWKGTPYHKGGHLKQVGVDCGTLLFEIYRAAGFVSIEDQRIFDQLAPVNEDWFCHTTEEKYLKLVLRHAFKVLEGISYRTLKAKPGNVAVTHHSPEGKIWNHGGLITTWPMVIHAIGPCVEEVDATQHWMWNFRNITVFDPWEKLAWESVS